MDLYFYSEVWIIHQFSSFKFYNWGDTKTPGTRETDESKIGLKQIGSPEEKGRKKLPTIIKYAGQGKDVYLCGKTHQNSFYKWTKLSSLEITIFYLKMTVKSGLAFLFWNSPSPFIDTC